MSGWKLLFLILLCWCQSILSQAFGHTITCCFGRPSKSRCESKKLPESSSKPPIHHSYLLVGLLCAPPLFPCWNRSDAFSCQDHDAVLMGRTVTALECFMPVQSVMVNVEKSDPSLFNGVRSLVICMHPGLLKV